MPIKFDDLSISTFHTDCHKLPVFLNVFLKILCYGLPIIQRGEKRKKTRTKKSSDDHLVLILANSVTY